MRRRDFIRLVGVVVGAWQSAARAEQLAMPVIGFMSARSAEDSVYVLAAFYKGLEESGFIDGRNVGRRDYGTTARDFFTIVLDLGPIVERASIGGQEGGCHDH